MTAQLGQYRDRFSCFGFVELRLSSQSLATMSRPSSQIQLIVCLGPDDKTIVLCETYRRLRLDCKRALDI